VGALVAVWSLDDCGGCDRHLGYATVVPRHAWSCGPRVTVQVDGDLDTTDVMPQQLVRVGVAKIKVKAQRSMEVLAEDLARQLRARGSPTAGLRFLCQDYSLAGSMFPWLVPYESAEREPWRGETVRTHDSLGGGSTVVRACYGSYTCPSSGITLFAVRCNSEPPCAKRRRVAAS
jgi:hypothetical protein